MHPDDDTQTTLSKWPFILGDALLVGTALAIAILGGWQLTNWQVASCVAAVALGAALFVLPYVVEFQVRVREEREDRAADLRILKKHILSAEQTLAALDARLRALEHSTADANRHNTALAEIADQKFAELEAARASQQEAIQALQQKLKEVPEKAPAALDPANLQSIEKRLEALEARPEPPAKASEPTAAADTPGDAPAPPAATKAQAMPAKTVAQIERPKRSARERHGPEESRLLRRAISDTGDNSSTAVSRIIEAKAKEQKPGKPIKQEEPEPTKPAPADEPKTPEDSAAPAADPSPPEEKKPDADETPGAAPPEEETAPRSDLPESGPAGGTPPAEGLDVLLEEAESSSPLPRTRAKKKDAVVTASVFIGIGNKPYLRGSGGGLSWDKGVVMEFEEIGKWQWVAPSDLDARLEVQVFRNDKDADTTGRYSLEPGQKLEITPVF